MSRSKVHIEVEVNPTEDIRKVKYAVENVFGIVELEEKPRHRCSLLIGQAKGEESLSRFGNLLRRERIRDAARTVLFKGLKGNTITFYLNKQVAYAGHLSFSEPSGESPLGPIRIQIIADCPAKLIDWLAPRTS